MSLEERARKKIEKSEVRSERRLLMTFAFLGFALGVGGLFEDTRDMPGAPLVGGALIALAILCAGREISSAIRSWER